MRLKCFALSFMLVLAPFLQTARAQVQTDAGSAATIKSDIAKRIAHKKTHVNIDMINGDKLRGRIEQADDNKFAIRQDKTNQRIELSYGDVRKVKGQGLGTGAKIGIIVGVAAVALAIVVVVALKNFDPFEGGISVP